MRREINLTHMDIMRDREKIDLAVRHRPGGSPGLFWLGGFRSTMDGLKANAIDHWADEAGLASTRFDYSGHGLSGGAFVDGTISRWLCEAKAVYETFAKGPQILIGSSMGGWLALLLALTQSGTVRSSPISGLVLIAPAYNMTQDLMWGRFDETIRQTIAKNGNYRRPSAYSDEPDIITNSLIEDGNRHLIDCRPIKLGIPVRILHGMNDDDVPWTHTKRLSQLLSFDDVVTTFVQDGDHRLSRPQDIEMLVRTVDALAQSISENGAGPV